MEGSRGDLEEVGKSHQTAVREWAGRLGGGIPDSPAVVKRSFREPCSQRWPTKALSPRTGLPWHPYLRSILSLGSESLPVSSMGEAPWALTLPNFRRRQRNRWPVVIPAERHTRLVMAAIITQSTRPTYVEF